MPHRTPIQPAHNPKVAGSNPAPAMKEKPRSGGAFPWAPAAQRNETGTTATAAAHSAGRATPPRVRRPVPGHGAHHWVFQLYALSRRLGLPSGANPRSIVSAING